MNPTDRREFLTKGAFAAGGLLGSAAWVASRFMAEPWTGEAEPPVSEGGGRRQVIPSACWQCVTRCPILGTVDRGRIVKIDGNPASAATRGRICAKGQAGVNQADNPDRLVAPLLRVGARGEGKWRRISWTQALDLLVEGGEVAGRRVRGLRELREAGTPEKFLFHYGRSVGSDRQILLQYFLPAYGTASVGNHDSICMATGGVADMLTGGGEAFSDFGKAAMVLNFGSSPLEATPDYVPTAQRFVEARARGARVVTFDPRLSNTAAKSSEWIPLKPATDLAVILAICQVIVQAGLYDAAFLRDHTNATAERLSAHLAQYTPEWAESRSGVPAGKIRSLALEYATRKPGICLSARGAFMHFNGVQTQRALALLQALTGNIDPAGPRAVRPAWKVPFTPPPKATRKLPLFAGGPGQYSHPLEGVSHQILPLIDQSPDRPDLYMVYCHNPVYSNGDCRDNARILSDPDKVPFLVAVDVGMGETALLADLVLPDAVYLERWTCDGKVTPEGRAEFQIRQPIRPPLGETRHFADVACEVAERLGLNLGFRSAEGYVRAACEATPTVQAAGGFEYMRAHGVWVDPALPGPGERGERMKLHSTDLEEAGFPALPSWVPVPEHEAMDADELILITYKVPVQTQSRTQNCKWLSELYHENRVWMNPVTARLRGLEDGGQAVVRSGTGEIRLPVRVTEGIHPGAVAISHHCGHWSHSDYASGQSASYHREEADGPLRWWSGHGSHVNLLIPRRGDPVAGGMRWNDTLVRVARATDRQAP